MPQQLAGKGLEGLGGRAAGEQIHHAPLLAHGLQDVRIVGDHAQHLEKPAEALHPLDTGAWALDYVRDSLKKLGDSAVKKNLNQALVAHN